MPAPYSYDMRKKALAAVRRGERKKNVSQMFNISRNTLDLWLKQEEKTGDCRAITNFQQGGRHKITDWQRFREFVREHGGGNARRNGEAMGRQRDSAEHQ
jgi:transposase